MSFCAPAIAVATVQLHSYKQQNTSAIIPDPPSWSEANNRPSKPKGGHVEVVMEGQGEKNQTNSQDKKKQSDI